jgi:hypothetical protein
MGLAAKSKSRESKSRESKVRESKVRESKSCESKPGEFKPRAQATAVGQHLPLRGASNLQSPPRSVF